MVVLALGLTLNTLTNLGVSPIISVPYSISQITGLNFINITFVVYAIFVVVQLAIHIKLKILELISIFSFLTQLLYPHSVLNSNYNKNEIWN